MIGRLRSGRAMPSIVRMEREESRASIAEADQLQHKPLSWNGCGRRMAWPIARWKRIGATSRRWRWLAGRGRNLRTARREDISAYHGACAGGRALDGAAAVGIPSLLRLPRARRAGLRRSHPAIERPRMPRSLPKALAEREIESLLGCTGCRHRAGPARPRHAGADVRLRPAVSELVELPLAALNPRQGVLRVTGKGGKDRLVPVGEIALQWVSAYLAKRAPATGAWPPAGGAVSQRRGDRPDPADVLDPGETLCAEGRHQPEPHSPHVLRHSFATHLLTTAPTCAPCRCCWATARSAPRRSTRWWPRKA